MDFTIEVCHAFNLSPFVVMAQDKDEVIMLINYFIQKGEAQPSEAQTMNTKTNAGAQQRVRVNDRTASGGWF